MERDKTLRGDYVLRHAIISPFRKEKRLSVQRHQLMFCLEAEYDAVACLHPIDAVMGVGGKRGDGRRIARLGGFYGQGITVAHVPMRHIERRRFSSLDGPGGRLRSWASPECHD